MIRAKPIAAHGSIHYTIRLTAAPCCGITVSTCCLPPGKERPTSSGLVTAVWPRSQCDDRLYQCELYSQSQPSTNVSCCGCGGQCAVWQQAPRFQPSRTHTPSMHAEHRLLAVVRAEAGDGAQKQLLQLAAAAPRHHNRYRPQLVSRATEDAPNGVRARLRLHIANQSMSGAAPETTRTLDDEHGRHVNALWRKHTLQADCRKVQKLTVTRCTTGGGCSACTLVPNRACRNCLAVSTTCSWGVGAGCGK